MPHSKYHRHALRIDLRGAYKLSYEKGAEFDITLSRLLKDDCPVG